jgi:hypothetical protein
LKKFRKSKKHKYGRGRKSQNEQEKQKQIKPVIQNNRERSKTDFSEGVSPLDGSERRGEIRMKSTEKQKNLPQREE